jgi:hypothetical protein
MKKSLSELISISRTTQKAIEGLSNAIAQSRCNPADEPSIVVQKAQPKVTQKRSRVQTPLSVGQKVTTIVNGVLTEVTIVEVPVDRRRFATVTLPNGSTVSARLRSNIPHKSAVAKSNGPEAPPSDNFAVGDNVTIIGSDQKFIINFLGPMGASSDDETWIQLRDLAHV